MKRILTISCCIILFRFASAQIGGRNVYDFLSFPTSSRMEGINGTVQSMKDADLSLSITNPCFLDSTYHKQLSITNSFYLDKMNVGNIAFAYSHPKIKSTIAYAFQYASYGKFDGRDAAGNSTGTYRASDFNMQAGIGRNWKNFYYGINLKLIVSQMASYISVGFATDVSLAYHSDKKNISAVVILRNAGMELKPYDKNIGREKLPLQLDVSVSKKFKHLPITLSVTAHNLQVWKLTFPEEEQQSVLLGSTKKKSKSTEIIDNIFRHVAFGLEAQAGKPVRLRFGYNHMRRQELGGVGKKKGFSGFSAGIGVNIKQFAFDYAYGAYSKVGSDHQLTFRIKLDEFGRKAK